MDFFDPGIQSYVEQHTEEESPLLKKIDRETNLRTLMPRMLSGHLQGRVLSMFSKMIRPSLVLEIGTFTGYSAICLAEGLADGGKIITLEKNEEIESMTRQFIREAGLEDVIELVLADAANFLKTFDQEIDLVFIDADKESYSHYFDLVLPKVRKGGFIIADNVLWSGKVVDENEIGKDKDTRSIVEFNQKVHEDASVENVLFPVRDGLMVLRKT